MTENRVCPVCWSPLRSDCSCCAAGCRPVKRCLLHPRPKQDPIHIEDYYNGDEALTAEDPAGPEDEHYGLAIGNDKYGQTVITGYVHNDPEDPPSAPISTD